MNSPIVKKGPETQKKVPVVRSTDPNDKASTSGYDAPGTDAAARRHFVSPRQTLDYMVFFENVATATVAVLDMKITDAMSTNTDWSTFAFGAMQVGDKVIELPAATQNYSTNIDLRPFTNAIVKVDCSFDTQTGLAQWVLTGCDPVTGDLLGGVDGFLPPNTDTMDPHGRGWVSYSVKPKAGLPTGTVITNQAVIDFEIDIEPEPMLTPSVFNTIDAVAPVSRLKSIPAVAPAVFNLSWDGQDDPGGSGIAKYTLQVKVNGSNDTDRVYDSTLSGCTFTGTPGNVYSFNLLATDGVGNRENAKSSSPDVTVVIGNLRDLDGDGRADIAAYRDGAWQFRLSGYGYTALTHTFGGAGWTALCGDYDRDARADLAVYRDGVWYFELSSQGYAQIGPFVFGRAGDEPVSADFDGDAMNDMAVYSAGEWYVALSSAGGQTVGPFRFGGAGWQPLAADFDRDGRADPAVFANGVVWACLSSGQYATVGPFVFGGAGFTPVAGDFDGDGIAEPAVSDAAGNWYFWPSSGGYAPLGPVSLTGSGFVPAR